MLGNSHTDPSPFHIKVGLWALTMILPAHEVVGKALNGVRRWNKGGLMWEHSDHSFSQGNPSLISPSPNLLKHAHPIKAIHTCLWYVVNVICSSMFGMGLALCLWNAHSVLGVLRVAWGRGCMSKGFHKWGNMIKENMTSSANSTENIWQVKYSYTMKLRAAMCCKGINYSFALLCQC